MKKSTPNYNIMLESAIFSLQQAYAEYKRAVVDSLKWSWIGDDGEFAFLAGGEERNKKVEELKLEVMRLKAKVEEIKGAIKAESEE